MISTRWDTHGEIIVRQVLKLVPTTSECQAPHPTNNAGSKFTLAISKVLITTRFSKHSGGIGTVQFNAICKKNRRNRPNIHNVDGLSSSSRSAHECTSFAHECAICLQGNQAQVHTADQFSDTANKFHNVPLYLAIEAENPPHGPIQV